MVQHFWLILELFILRSMIYHPARCNPPERMPTFGTQDSPFPLGNFGTHNASWCLPAQHPFMSSEGHVLPLLMGERYLCAHIYIKTAHPNICIFQLCCIALRLCVRKKNNYSDSGAQCIIMQEPLLSSLLCHVSPNPEIGLR